MSWRSGKPGWRPAALLAAVALLLAVAVGALLRGAGGPAPAALGVSPTTTGIEAATSTTRAAPPTTRRVPATSLSPAPPDGSAPARRPPASIEPTPAAPRETTPPRAASPRSTRPSTPTRPRPSAADWGRPVFEERFDGEALDTASWYVYDSPEARPPRSPEAVTVRGGSLRLTGGFDAQGKDVSGGLGHRLNQKYGRWEVRFRADRGAGYSPAVLLWPQTEDWPSDGEIDLAELPRGDRSVGYCFLHNGPGNDIDGCRMDADFHRWHTVAVDWLPDHVTFWLDGVAQKTWQAPSRYIPTTSAMHLALQNDQGCDGFIQCRNPRTPPQVVMQVDWVRVYQAPAEPR